MITQIVIKLEIFSQQWHSRWLLQVHMASKNETVSRQNLCANNIAL